MHRARRRSRRRARRRLRLGRRRRRRSVGVTVASWTVAAPVAVWALASVWPIGWRADLAANLCAQGALAGLTIGGALAALRRPLAASAALAGALVMAGVLVWSRAGAASPARASAARTPITLLQYNVGPGNATPDEAIRLILDAGADVVSLVEAPNAVIDAVRPGGALRAQYPYVRVSPRARTGYPLLLTRWPQLGPSPDDPGAWSSNINDTAYRGMLVARVEHPSGPILVVQATPRSPRTAARWREGNALMVETASVLDERAGGARSPDLPVIVAADFNASPTGRRSRLAASLTSLRRAKPLTYMGGTFPASLAWPLRVAIDDAMVSPGVSVRSWRTLRPAGSDHLPVLMRLEVRRASGAARQPPSGSSVGPGGSSGDG